MNIPTSMYEIFADAHKEAARSKDYYYGKLDYSYLARPLKELALQIKGVPSLTEEEVVLLFFSAPALGKLMMLPNSYWLFTVLVKALISHATELAGGAFVPIELVTIEQVIADTRDSLNYDYGLDRPHETLNVLETAAWVAEGLLLVSINERREIELVRNYIFQSPSSHKRRLVAVKNG